MYVERSAGAAFVAQPGCRRRALRLAPQPQRSAVGAAWFELSSHAATRLSSDEGDRLLIVLAGEVELHAEREPERLGAGDAALVFDARSCTVRAADGDARVLTVWLESQPATATSRVVLQRDADAPLSDEFNTRFRRLPLLPKSEAVDWGGALAHLAPAQHTTPHSHVDDEAFVILTGHGRLRVGSESCDVRAGDVVHLPSGQEHTIENLMPHEELMFLCTWWTDFERHPLQPLPH
jgi:quercetin dioxygenase-like cupin family protein